MIVMKFLNAWLFNECTCANECKNVKFNNSSEINYF